MGDLALQLGHPRAFGVIEGLDDDPVRVEEQRVRPDDVAVLHVRAMDVHDATVVEIDRRGIARARWRGVGMPGNPHEDLRMVGEQRADRRFGLRDKIGRIDVAIVAVKRPVERRMKEDDRRSLPMVFEFPPEPTSVIRLNCGKNLAESAQLYFGLPSASVVESVGQFTER